MSCMSFGELNIPSSRAFWDDCDEDEIIEATEENKLQLTYEPEQEGPMGDVDQLFIIEGTNIIDFVQQTLLASTTKVCSIPSKRSALYRVNNRNVLIAVIEEDLTNSGEVTELLVPIAEGAKEVNTISVKPKVDYKSENIALVRDEITFLRAINPKLNYIEVLKTPNFIAGVAAGVASWRENKNMPVSSYVAYTDNVFLDALAAKPILKLIQHLGIECSSSYSAKLRDDSHLYL